MKLVTEDFEPSEKLRKTQSKERHNAVIEYLEAKVAMLKSGGHHLSGVVLCAVYHNGLSSNGVLVPGNSANVYPALTFAMDRVKHQIVEAAIRSEEEVRR